MLWTIHGQNIPGNRYVSLNMFLTHILISSSLERVQQYLEIEQEPEPSNAGVPPAYWPASGELVVENLTARYSPVSDLVNSMSRLFSLLVESGWA